MTACKMYALLAKYFWVQVYFWMGYFNSLNVWQLLLLFESQIWFPSLVFFFLRVLLPDLLNFLVFTRTLSTWNLQQRCPTLP